MLINSIFKNIKYFGEKKLEVSHGHGVVKVYTY